MELMVIQRAHSIKDTHCHPPVQVFLLHKHWFTLFNLSLLVKDLCKCFRHLEEWEVLRVDYDIAFVWVRRQLLGIVGDKLSEYSNIQVRKICDVDLKVRKE